MIGREEEEIFLNDAFEKEDFCYHDLLLCDLVKLYLTFDFHVRIH